MATRPSESPTSRPTTAPVYQSSTEPRPRDAGWLARHNGLVERAHGGNIDLYLLGDSITDNWERGFPANYKKSLGGWKPGDFGISGDRTEHVLYRITNGELDGVKPKLIMLMIGTNNLPYRPDVAASTPEETAAGVKAILDVLRQKQPQAKVLLLAIFPRSDRPTAAAKIEPTNRILATFDDGEHVKFLNINEKLLEADGTLSKDVMPDLLHPNEIGYQRWSDAVRPTLVEMLGEPAAN